MSEQRLLEDTLGDSCAEEFTDAAGNGWLPAFCSLPFHDHTLAKLIDLTLHGFVVVSGIAATYVLVGGKRGAACSPTMDSPLPIPYQTLVACLPYLLFPVAVILGAFLKTCLEEGQPRRNITIVSVLQLLIVFVLMSWMAVCMSATVKGMFIGFACMIGTLLLAWGFASGRVTVPLGLMQGRVTRNLAAK